MTRTAPPAPTVETGTQRYVYGVVRADDGSDAVTDLAGATGEVVAVVVHGELAAVVEAIPDADAVPAARFVRAHARVLDAVAARCSVLPLRFGTVVASDEAVVEELLAPDRDHLVDALEQLDGHVQLLLRARYVLDTVLAEVVAEHPQVRELRARTRDLPDDAAMPERVRLGELVSQAIETKRAADREAMLAVLQPHARRSSVRSSGGLDGLLDLAVLVDEHGVADFEAHAQAAAAQMAGRAELELIGPMAPYDFASDGV
ncbi:GvpL/GvpF family gas vesicle protein [Oryzihumus sp.]